MRSIQPNAIPCHVTVHNTNPSVADRPLCSIGLYTACGFLSRGEARRWIRQQRDRIGKFRIVNGECPTSKAILEGADS